MKTLEQRFDDKWIPEPNTGCWFWTGAGAKDGYGRFKTGNGKMTQATHFSLQIVGVTIPPGMCACHTCDQPSCVNPEHLFVGTPKKNTQDAVDKGRMAKGERISNAKLTDADVLAIRFSLETGPALAARFGVSRAAISLIRVGKTWKHVGGTIRKGCGA